MRKNFQLYNNNTVVSYLTIFIYVSCRGHQILPSKIAEDDWERGCRIHSVESLTQDLGSFTWEEFLQAMSSEFPHEIAITFLQLRFLNLI